MYCSSRRRYQTASADNESTCNTRDTHYTSLPQRGSCPARMNMIVLTYRIETPDSTEALAAKIASDQSTGTFVALPGETPELKARVAARVLAVRPLEPTKTPALPDVPGTLVQSRRGRHRLSDRGGRYGPFGADDHRHRRHVFDQGADRHSRRRYEAAGGVPRRLSRTAIRRCRQPAADRRRRPADHRQHRQASARAEAARERRNGRRVDRRRGRFHQGRREADEPGLFAASPSA